MEVDQEVHDHNETIQQSSNYQNETNGSQNQVNTTMCLTVMNSY